MKALSKVLVILSFLFSAPAFAQGAWDYLELLHSSTSDAQLDRWTGVSTFCAEESPEIDCLAFDLPKLLVGDRNLTIELKASRQPDRLTWTMTGPKADAFCALGGTGESCLILFKDLDLDPAAIDAYLVAQFTDANQLRVVRNNAHDFRNRPVLRYWHGFH